MELTIALVLVVLLMGLAVGSFYGTLESTRIKENSGRMASLLRALRAEAANAGKRFRLSIDEDTGQPVVAVEPCPLEEPGVFRTHQAWWVELGRLDGGVRVIRCELTGAGAFALLEAFEPGGEEGPPADLHPVMFYPDGTSDSVSILLANDDEDRPWAAEITLNGVDGTIETRKIDTEEEPIEEL